MAVWFINKKDNRKWHVDEKSETYKRLIKDPDYEIAEESNPAEPVKQIEAEKKRGRK